MPVDSLVIEPIDHFVQKEIVLTADFHLTRLRDARLEIAVGSQEIKLHPVVERTRLQ